jgi:hypothetical protein
MKVPVRVQGREPSGASWEEMTTCEDASTGGVAFTLQRHVRVGQILHLSLPLPIHFRQHDLAEASYRVYGLVRNVRSGGRVGVFFLGKYPPRGADALPAELFLMPGDPRPPAGTGRYGFGVTLRLDAEQAPGGVAQEERSFAENLSSRRAEVKTASLPVLKGATITVEELGGDFRSRAEVSSISIGKDGSPRLSLLFLDEPVPDRLLPPPAEESPAS